MIKDRFQSSYDEPIWKMWRCDNYRRWTTVKDGICDTDKDEGLCYFSGCKEGEHRIHLIGETADREKAHKWFRGYRGDSK